MIGQLAFPEPAKAFDGATYDPIRDYDRLAKQMKCVVLVMRAGTWWTLHDIAAVANGSEAGVSARLRDLRKRKYGSQKIERRRVQGGLWEYRWNRGDKS